MTTQLPELPPEQDLPDMPVATSHLTTATALLWVANAVTPIRFMMEPAETQMFWLKAALFVYGLVAGCMAFFGEPVGRVWAIGAMIVLFAGATYGMWGPRLN